MKKGDIIKCLGYGYPHWKDEVFECTMVFNDDTIGIKNAVRVSKSDFVVIDENGDIVSDSLIGTIHTKEIIFKIEIKKLDKLIPSSEISNFLEWIKYKSIEVGIGIQFEYYSYSNNSEDDIGVLFLVS